MIQELAIEEIDALVPLVDQYMVFYGKESNPVAYAAYLRERLARKEATVFLSRDGAGVPNGFVLNYHTFSSVSQGSVIVLNDLFVVESARKRGIGRQLIERVFQLARDSGAVRVDLGTQKTNRAAQSLYERLGFVRDTEFYSYSYPIRS